MRTVSGPSERSGARRLGHPSGMFHEDRKRAQRTIGGSTFGSPVRRVPTRTVSGPSERSGARRSGHPSGVFHEDRERADRSLRGSTPRNNSGLSANLRKYLLQPKARSKSTTLRQEKRVTDSLTLHSIDKSIKHRVGGYT